MALTLLSKDMLSSHHCLYNSSLFVFKCVINNLVHFIKSLFGLINALVQHVLANWCTAFCGVRWQKGVIIIATYLLLNTNIVLVRCK